MVRIVSRAAHIFATDPLVQYKFNLWGTIIWTVVLLSSPLLPPFTPFTHFCDLTGCHTVLNQDHLGALLIYAVSIIALQLTQFGSLGANVAALIAAGDPKFKKDSKSAEDILAEDGYGKTDWLFGDDDPTENFLEPLLNHQELPVAHDTTHLTG